MSESAPRQEVVITAKLASIASEAIDRAMLESDLTMFEMAAMFRIAAGICDETQMIKDRSTLSMKMNSWRGLK